MNCLIFTNAHYLTTLKDFKFGRRCPVIIIYLHNAYYYTFTTPEDDVHVLSKAQHSWSASCKGIAARFNKLYI